VAEFQVNITGNVPAAAAEGAAALRDEGAAAREATGALSGMGAATALLEQQAKAFESLSSAIRDASTSASDFTKSKWDTSGGPGARPEAKRSEGQKAPKQGKGLKDVLGAAGNASKDFASKAASVGTIAKGAAVGLVAYGAALAGIHGVSELTKMAIGWRGAAQLQMLSMKATMDLRRAVRGVDPQPLVRAFTSLEKNISSSTVTGKALSGILTRAYNTLFQSAEKGGPLLERMFQGAVLGALELESAWLDLRIAAQPLTKAVGELLGSEKGMGSAADVGAAAFRGLASAVELTAKGLSAVVEAYKYLDARAKRSAMPEEEQIRLGNAERDAAERAKREEASPERLRDVYTEHENGQVTKEMFKGNIPVSDRAEDALPPHGAAAGKATGSALGQGMAQGLDGQAGALGQAGKDAVEHVVKGAQTAGEIHSPSARTRRDVGRQLGAGVVLGAEDMAPQVQRAGENLVPNLGGSGGGAPAGGAPMPSLSIGQIGPFHFGDAVPKDVQALAEKAVRQAVRSALIRSGLSVPIQ